MKRKAKNYLNRSLDLETRPRLSIEETNDIVERVKEKVNISLSTKATAFLGIFLTLITLGSIFGFKAFLDQRIEKGIAKEKKELRELLTLIKKDHIKRNLIKEYIIKNEVSNFRARSSFEKNNPVRLNLYDDKVTQDLFFTGFDNDFFTRPGLYEVDITSSHTMESLAKNFGFKFENARNKTDSLSVLTDYYDQKDDTLKRIAFEYQLAIKWQHTRRVSDSLWLNSDIPFLSAPEFREYQEANLEELRRLYYQNLIFF